MSGPEPAERRQPGFHLLKGFRFQSVETALCVHRGFHKTGLAQHAQVLGHGRLRHAKLTLDLSHRLLGRDQQAQYRAAVRLRYDFENRCHFLCIPCRAYTCQGILRQEGTGDSFRRRAGMRRPMGFWRVRFRRRCPSADGHLPAPGPPGYPLLRRAGAVRSFLPFADQAVFTTRMSARRMIAPTTAAAMEPSRPCA